MSKAILIRIAECDVKNTLILVQYALDHFDDLQGGQLLSSQIYLDHTRVLSESGSDNITTGSSARVEETSITCPCFLYGQTVEQIQRWKKIQYLAPSVSYYLNGAPSTTSSDDDSGNDSEDFDDEPLHVHESRCRGCAREFLENQPFDCVYEEAKAFVEKEHKEQNETRVYIRPQNCHFAQVLICNGKYICGRCDDSFPIGDSIRRCRSCLAHICLGQDKCAHWHSKKRRRCNKSLCDAHILLVKNIEERCGLCFKEQVKNVVLDECFIEMKICKSCADYFASPTSVVPASLTPRLCMK